MVTACLLVGLLGLALAFVASALLASHQRLTRQQSADRVAFLGMWEKLQELTSLRYVQDHLDKFGVGPYMLSCADRLNRDIHEIMTTLGVDETEAIEYMRQGIRGLDDGREPDSDETADRERYPVHRHAGQAPPDASLAAD